MLVVMGLYCMDVIIYIFRLLEKCLSYDLSLDRYKYETSIRHFSESNVTETIMPCLATGNHSHEDEFITAESQRGE